jgi:alanine racemase
VTNSDTQEVIDRIRAGTHAVVDLDAYVANIRSLRALAPEGAAFMAVVKADAYGHGMLHCGKAAAEVVDFLGVARVDEALRLRRAEVSTPILVLGPANPERLAEALSNGITITVGTQEHLEQLVRAVESSGRRATVHLKVDTGMRRYGFIGRSAVDAAVALDGHPEIDLEGLYSHYSSADETDLTPTRDQLDSFNEVISGIRHHGIYPRFIHVANSAGIIAGIAGNSNLVRSGIATYGLSPSDELQLPVGFRPVLSMFTSITRCHQLGPGEGVSYGLSYKARASEDVAATGIGYADGLPRQLSNTGWFVVREQRASIRGRVCMDQTVIARPVGAQVGDRVRVFGAGQAGEMTLDAIASIAGTNNYEIATRVTARVPRLYVRRGQVVAWEHLLLGESHIVVDDIDCEE